ncbi:MAG TPA: cell division protein FtsA, partial [Candidatus Pelagibacter sp.]|nr:cell division protein FtsA [Candidatus Pelagibacter sp.]
MKLNNLNGVVEIGNINIKCIIFNVNNNVSEIISTSVTPSEGIHNGVIINVSRATNAIRKSISNAEKKAEILLKQINVILEQPEFLCTRLSKHKKINGSKIYKDDIEFLLKEAKKQVTHNDTKQSIIHIFNHNYIVDGKKFIEEPIDVYADYLSHEMTFITMPKNNIKNISQIFSDCDIKIERFISNIFSLAANSLSYNDLHSGSVLIDFGFERTSIGIFKNLALINSATFPVGVNHITKDISKVCSLSLEESENIRNKINFLFEKENLIFDNNDNLKSTFFIDSNFRKISKSLILNIVKSRINEIFEIVKKHLTLNRFNTSANSKFFIAGGGSNLFNLDKSLSKFFDINVKKVIAS